MILAAAGIWQRGVDFFLGAAPFLTVGLCLFLVRVMGAGDGKLMAVIGGYLGIAGGFYAVSLGFFIGALWSLWKLKRYGLAAARFGYLKRYVETAVASKKLQPYDALEPGTEVHHIPFAACLAAGVWLYLAWTVLAA